MAKSACACCEAFAQAHARFGIKEGWGRANLLGVRPTLADTPPPRLRRRRARLHLRCLAKKDTTLSQAAACASGLAGGKPVSAATSGVMRGLSGAAFMNLWPAPG